MENDAAKFKQYLLGNLSAKETEEIDLQILADESLEEKLLWAESELVEEFLEGSLTPEEIKLFKANFLISETRENQLKEIAWLKKYAENNRNSIREFVFKPISLSERLKNFFTINRRPLTALFALLIVCLAIGISWKFLFDAPNNELATSGKATAPADQRDLSNLSNFGDFSKVNLSPDTFRDFNSANKLNSNNLTENVFFRLALPFEVSGDRLFNVQITKDQNPIYYQKQVRVYKNQSGQEIRLIVPKSHLTKGQYRIRIEDSAVKDSALNYDFAVE